MGEEKLFLNYGQGLTSFRSVHRLNINTKSANHNCSRRHHTHFFIVFSEKIRLDRFTKYQALFSLKDESKKLKRRLLQFLFDIFRVNKNILSIVIYILTFNNTSIKPSFTKGNKIYNSLPLNLSKTPILQSNSALSSNTTLEKNNITK